MVLALYKNSDYTLLTSKCDDSEVHNVAFPVAVYYKMNKLLASG